VSGLDGRFDGGLRVSGGVIHASGRRRARSGLRGNDRGRPNGRLRR